MFSSRLWQLFLDSFPKILLPGLTATIPLTIISFSLALVIAVVAALVQFANIQGLKQILCRNHPGGTGIRSEGPAGSRSLCRTFLFTDHFPHRAPPGDAYRISAAVQLPDLHGQGYLSGSQHHRNGNVHGHTAHRGAHV